MPTIDVRLLTAEGKEKNPLCAPPQCDWVSLEKDFEAHRRYKSVCGRPEQEQLELARQEWIDRFMKDDGKDSGVPAVLVATNVPKSWEPHESDRTYYLLTEDGSLYVRKVPSDAHGRMLGKVIESFGGYLQTTQTQDFISADDAVRKLLAGAVTEPDIALRPTFSWDANDNHKARGMIEIEYKHRGTDDSRQRGFAFLNTSHFHRFYMLIRVFPRRQNTTKTDNTFPAACVLWRKNTAHAATPAPPAVPPAPPGCLVWSSLVGPTLAASPIANAAAVSPAVSSAIGGILPGEGYDFGTAPLPQTALADLTAVLGPGSLPPAAFGAPLGPWTATNDLAFQVAIPAIDVFYLVPDQGGGLVSPAVDWIVNLGHLQKTLDKGLAHFSAPADAL